MFYKLLAGLSAMVVSSGAWSMTLKDNNDGTILDMDTGLTWQQADDDTRRDWKSAQRYCSELSLGGHTDWRLPGSTELASIVVYKQNPAIDENLFPSSKSSHYWSASSMAGNPSMAWNVDFYYGPVDFSSKSKNHYVRCVR